VVKDAELEVDFEDLAKDFTVNGNDISLNIKIRYGDQEVTSGMGLDAVVG
jgi:hypothetical protein